MPQARTRTSTSSAAGVGMSISRTSMFSLPAMKAARISGRILAPPPAPHTFPSLLLAPCYLLLCPHARAEPARELVGMALRAAGADVDHLANQGGKTGCTAQRVAFARL